MLLNCALTFSRNGSIGSRFCTLVTCSSSVCYSPVISTKLLLPFHIIHTGGPLLSTLHSCLPKARAFKVLAADTGSTDVPPPCPFAGCVLCALL